MEKSPLSVFDEDGVERTFYYTYEYTLDNDVKSITVESWTEPEAEQLVFSILKDVKEIDLIDTRSRWHYLKMTKSRI